MFWNRNKNIIITFLFVIDLAIHEIYILEYQPGKPGIALLWPIVAEDWNFYHTCLGFSFLYLLFHLLFVH